MLFLNKAPYLNSKSFPILGSEAMSGESEHSGQETHLANLWLWLAAQSTADTCQSDSRGGFPKSPVLQILRGSRRVGASTP